MNEIRLKECSDCREKFPATVDYYYSIKRRPDGLDNYCKYCRRERGRKPNSEKKRPTTKPNTRSFCCYCGMPTKRHEFHRERRDKCLVCVALERPSKNSKLTAQDIERCQSVAHNLLIKHGLTREKVWRFTWARIHRLRRMQIEDNEKPAGAG